MRLVALVALAAAFGEESPPVDMADVRRGFLAAGVWTLAAMAIGWSVAFCLRLEAADRFTFLIEFSARNIAVAAIVAMSGLGRVALSFFGGVYFAIGYPLAALAVWLRRRRVDRESPAVASEP